MKKSFKRLIRRAHKGRSSAHKRFDLSNRQVLLIATAFCFLLIAISFFDSSSIAPFRALANYTVVPMEKGINRIGTWLSNQADNFRSLKDVKEENEKLKEQVNELTLKNEQLSQSSYELTRLQELYELDTAYQDYPKTAAHVIGKDSGNWFHLFTIDKGTNDGIEVDMNVIAGSGLVGIVTEVGPDWATVESIIDDTVSVSAMTSSTSDICYVNGDLEQFEEGTLPFTDMKNNDNAVQVGDTLVTSYISSKYLPGITIGYISEIHVDSNNLTRSGSISLAADFDHLQEVLVITQKKQNTSDDKSSTSKANEGEQ